jgi:hypothetical protein
MKNKYLKKHKKHQDALAAIRVGRQVPRLAEMY